jgi:MoaA/NifB/PqqE/SkfB family radical SAM enzyme
MSLRGRFKLRALELAQPITAHLELTYRCNWRCVFCYNPRHHDRKRLSGKEWVVVLDDLRKLGTLTVTLTGGDPMTHPKFFEIARAARARAFALRIFTNGSLVTDSAADEIAALYPLGVEMSLHGSTADVHDRATSTAGSFDRMIEGLGRLRNRSVPLVLKAPLTRLNEHQLADMVALVEGMGIPFQLDGTITPKDDGDPSPLAYSASTGAIRRMLELARGTSKLEPVERQHGGTNCGLGRITVAVDPEGNVFPCIQWRHTSLGNVRERRLHDLWHESPERRGAAAVAVAANDRLLGMGPALSAFPFCPALAFQQTGDPTMPDLRTIACANFAAELRDEDHPAALSA